MQVVLKKCTKCKLTKILTVFVKRNTVSGYGSWCKECANKHIKQPWEKRNRKKIAVKNKKWYKNNKKEAQRRFNEYRRTHRDICNAQVRRYKAKSKENHKRGQKDNNRVGTKDRLMLRDRYIKKLLVGKTSLCFNDILGELVELKREQVRLSRELKRQAS